MPGKLIRANFISRADLRANPDTLYVFGDNMRRSGRGGQAREMRGEPNAVGIPTKWTPHMSQASFFSDADWSELLTVRYDIMATFDRLERYMKAGGTVVIPTDGIGTGLAELPKRAPLIFAYIEDRIRGMEALAYAE